MQLLSLILYGSEQTLILKGKVHTNILPSCRYKLYDVNILKHMMTELSF